MSNRQTENNNTSKNPTLKRSLNLPLLVLYGLGTTIGAEIYVLVGSAAGQAGLFAPLSFLLAAIAIAPSAAAYAELSGRFPVSAAEAVYVENGFKSTWMANVAGMLVVVSGVVAAATITVGCAGYIRVFFDWPYFIVIPAIVLSMGLIAAVGILESVLVAAVFTIIEVGGLLLLINAGLGHENVTLANASSVFTGAIDSSVWSGIAAAGLLAVFAFIGFEDMVNVVEETQKPMITMPLAIAATLTITAVLYFFVTLVSVLAVPPAELAQSEAPLSMVYETLTGRSAVVISGIAIFATLNTILVQFIMASRVIYGMADRLSLPNIFARVHPSTQTPLLATAVVAVLTVFLALAVPLDSLAEYTSFIILTIWTLSNTALILIKLRNIPAPAESFTVPLFVPILGLVCCVIFILVSLIGT